MSDERGELMRNRTASHFLTGVAVAMIVGCGQAGDTASAVARPRVVVYSSLDREFSEPVLKAYAKQTGVEVLPKFDVESTKTVGLTNLIIAEAGRPRCDLFWNNEILNTLRLKEKGLLAPFQPSPRRRPARRRSRPRTGPGMASPAGPAS